MAKRVLLVDDESSVRTLIVASVRALGHEGEAAAGPVEALELLEQGPPFDVLLLDLNLGVVSGEETLEQMRAQLGGVRVVIMTGLEGGEVHDRLVGVEYDALLSKPFSLARLSEVLEGR